MDGLPRDHLKLVCMLPLVVGHLLLAQLSHSSFVEDTFHLLLDGVCPEFLLLEDWKTT